MDESFFPRILVFQFLFSFAYLGLTVGEPEHSGYFQQFYVCLEFQSQGNADERAKGKLKAKRTPHPANPLPPLKVGYIQHSSGTSNALRTKAGEKQMVP